MNIYWPGIRHDLSRKREGVIQAIVWRLPRSIVYWAAIRLGGHATTGKYGSQIVPDLYFTDALERWDGKA
jgi:hypothetical protein